MNAIQQRCRPKHQVLVLKCYPRTTKGAVDVKPNSSELSYLLYYATSRKTKIQKVGTFLEKKTASDVWRLRIGNVQVTLQILEALIEKNPKDLPLFAPSVLKILDLILRSNDITMVESSVPTFEAFCANHDASSLFADQAYLRQYEAVVKQYASLASTRGSPGKVPPSKPVAMRWRNSGLEAIKSLASSDALSSVAGRQFDVVVPMILENLWTDNEDFLEVLLQRAHVEEKVNTEGLLKRRTSIATVRTADTAGDTNPIALSGTAGDVDKLAEEDIGVLAMQCLKQIFIVPNRSQIHAATAALLKFIEERVNQEEAVVKTNNGKDSGWAIKMLGLVSRWAPVQDRYIILVTAMDTLVRTQLKPETMRQHIVLTAMIGSLLRSDINLIGLSVMDVLLSLIQHMKRLVQMPGDPAGGSEKETAAPAERVDGQRKELLGRIQQAMGDLATHVYYADQISDMISAILLRLKPKKSGSTAASTPHGERSDAETKVSDDTHLESLFSLTVAKTTALRAVKSILAVANPKIKISGNINLSRNRVPVQVWEGSHWLLRDPDGQVRKAYADALVTWLDRETTRADLTARDESRSRARLEPPNVGGRRVLSAASGGRDKPVKPPRTHFLELLHIAIYDNALQFVDYENDIALLHVLLAKLVTQFGVNAVRFGLPMIFRLQEDIQDAETPLQKVRLGSLCHGYFWALTEKFDCEASVVGRAIHNEIIRRRTKHFWVDGVQVPPPLIELVGTPGVSRPQPKMQLHEVESEALLPFDDRLSLVDCICTSYQDVSISPPLSPPGSPGRVFSQPILGAGLGGLPQHANSHEIPSSFREQMLTEWSREVAMIAIQEASKSASLNGSRTGTNGTNLNRLANNGAMTNGATKENGSPSPLGGMPHVRPQSQPAPKGASLAPIMPKARKTSIRSGISPNPDSISSRGVGYVTSVDQLKMALSGNFQPPPMTGERDDDESSDDSMVSYDLEASELSFQAAQNQDQNQIGVHAQTADQIEGSQQRSRSMSRDRRGSDGASLGPLNSNPPHEAVPIIQDEEEEVPPVPPLPSDLAVESPGRRPSVQIQAPPPVARDYAEVSPTSLKMVKQRGLKSRGGESTISSAFSGDNPLPAMDLQSLLKGIDSRAGENSLGNVTRPPY